MFGRWISLLSFVRKIYIKLYYWKILNMPKFIELMTTENKTEIRNLSMFIMKSFEIRKTHTFLWLVCPSRFLFLYIHVVVLLIRNCIYNEGRWIVDLYSLYLCIMNVYMFVYCLYTERHFCLLYSVINSWNSLFLSRSRYYYTSILDYHWTFLVLLASCQRTKNT